MKLGVHAVFCSCAAIVILNSFQFVDSQMELAANLDKRLPHPLHQYAMRSMQNLEHTRYIINKSLEQFRIRQRRGHKYMTDAGYGSRVAAGSNLALSQMARHGIYGIHGPGRRKRPSANPVDIISLEN